MLLFSIFVITQIADVPEEKSYNKLKSHLNMKDAHIHYLNYDTRWSAIKLN